MGGAIIFWIFIFLLFQALELVIFWAIIKSSVRIGVQQALWETVPKFCSENQNMPPRQNFMPPQNVMPPQQGFYNMPPR